MEVSWDLYKVFYFVCQFRNITKAANYLYVTQPAITKKIKTLEEQLGVNLIVSSNKGIEITDEGMELYNSIKQAFDVFDGIESKYNGPANEIKTRITISGGYTTVDKVIIPTIIKLNKKYPDVKFNVETCSFEESVKKLNSGEVDLFFYGYDRYKPESDEVVIKECFDIQNGFVVSSKIRNEFPDKISIYDLNMYPLITKDTTGRSRIELEKMLQEKGITLKPKYEVTTYMAIKEYIESNLGIGFLNPEYIKDEIESGKFVQIPTIEEVPKIKIYCAYLKNSINKAIIKEFIELVKQKMNKSLF